MIKLKHYSAKCKQRQETSRHQLPYSMYNPDLGIRTSKLFHTDDNRIVLWFTVSLVFCYVIVIWGCL
jgi:hypothetical protein